MYSARTCRLWNRPTAYDAFPILTFAWESPRPAREKFRRLRLSHAQYPMRFAWDREVAFGHGKESELPDGVGEK